MQQKRYVLVRKLEYLNNLVYFIEKSCSDIMWELRAVLFSFFFAPCTPPFDAAGCPHSTPAIFLDSWALLRFKTHFKKVQDVKMSLYLQPPPQKKERKKEKKNHTFFLSLPVISCQRGSE